ncbi:hypothetical protein [Sagittula sp. S175]|uniref:hypothetical protein n=1 Tax=Sagittula sp. S175 TaxID=3415129 RepID=UPI003C7CC108
MTTQNRQVSITFDLLEQILAAGLSITTMRLLIGMIYMQDRADLWRSDDLYLQHPEQAKTWAFCAELRSLVGPVGANNARSVKTLIAETAGRGLFEEITLSDLNRQIHWQFCGSVHAMMSTRWLGANFALLDVENVRACRTPMSLELYCRLRNLRKHPIPEFELPLTERWSVHRPKLMPALKQVVAMENTTAFVGLELVRQGVEYQRLRLRFRHKGTTWFPEKIRFWSLGARVFRVSPDEIVEIDGKDFRCYAIPGENPTKVEANLRKNLAGAGRS